MKTYKIALREYVRKRVLIKVGRADRVLLSSTEFTNVNPWVGYWAEKEKSRFFVVVKDDGKPEPVEEKKLEIPKVADIKDDGKPEPVKEKSEPIKEKKPEKKFRSKMAPGLGSRRF